MHRFTIAAVFFALSMLAVGCVVFAGTAVWIATFPVSVVI